MIDTASVSPPADEPTLSLRRARRRDAAQLAPLIVDLAGPEVDEFQAARRFRRLLRSPSYQSYVLATEDEPIALWVGRSGYLFAAEAPAMQLVALVVSAEHRGQGLGRRLMQECPPKDRFSQSWLITQHDHLHGYYSSLGWSETGARFVRHSSPAAKRPLWWRIANKVMSA